MPRVNDKPKRWNPPELIEIFNYLNDNFVLWFENPHVACIRAIEATDVSRGINSVYAKVHKMIKAMENYLKSGKKKTCDIIWEDRRIYVLVKRLCRKSNERRAKQENQEVLRKKDKKLGYKSASEIDIADVEMKVEVTNDDPPAAESEPVDHMIPQIPFSIEMVEKLYQEQIQKAERHVQQLMSLSKETIDARYKEVRELTGQIYKRQCELRKMIIDVNDKVEKLKDSVTSIDGFKI